MWHIYPPPAPAYVYSEQFQRFDLGPTHPLQNWRLRLADDLIKQLELDIPAYSIQPATRKDLGSYHDHHYLDVLQGAEEGKYQAEELAHFGLGQTDNPVFPGLFDYVCLLAGSTLRAADLVHELKYPIAFNMAGGMHHGLAGRAAGFCYINDVVIGIISLVRRGKRVAYIDLDAHHGDGVQWAFYDTDQVLTISLHQHPSTLFPGTGSLEEMGRGQGRGYSVNLPLWPDTDDDIYIRSFEEIVPPLLAAYKPDYIVSQLGVDAFASDPLANLNLTTKGYMHCLVRLREMAQGRWIATGGGGYNVINAARGMALAWAVIRKKEGQLPDMMPKDWCEYMQIPPDQQFLLDPREKLRGRMWNRAQRDALEAVDFLKTNLFPILNAR